MRSTDLKVIPVGGDPENSENPPRAYVNLFEDGERRMAVMMRNPDNHDAGQPVHFDKDLMKDCVVAVKDSPKAGWEFDTYTLIDVFDSGQEEVRWASTVDGEPRFRAANKPMTATEFEDRVFSFGESMEVDLSKESFNPKNKPPVGPNL